MVEGQPSGPLLAAFVGASVLPAAGVARLLAGRARRWGRWFSGGTCIGLGVLTALTGQRSAALMK